MGDNLFGHSTGRGALAALLRRRRRLGLPYPSFYLPCDESGTTGVLNVTPAISWGTTAPTVQSRNCVAYTDIINTSTDVITLTQVSANQMRYARRKDANGLYLGGYLAELEVENLIDDSELIQNWAKTRCTVSANTAVAPNGETTADTLAEDGTAANTHFASTASVNYANATQYVVSIWAQKINRTWLRFAVNNNGTNSTASFDLDNGVIGGTSNADGHGMINYGNDWYRCWMTWVHDAAEARAVAVQIAEGDEDPIFDGLSQNSLYVFGAQVEAGNYPTSYIETPNGATATRLKDQLRYEGLANLGGVGSNQQGALACKALLPNIDTPAAYLITLSDGGAAADRVLLRGNAAGDTIGALTAATGGNGGLVNSTTQISSNVVRSIAAQYKKNHLSLIIDGASEGTVDTTVDIPDDLDRIDIGQSWTAGEQLNGIISDIRIYPRFVHSATRLR
jgi:hypothetical protein